MRRPRLEACYFAASAEDPFARMARVLEVTAAEHCANWDRAIRRIEPRRRRSAIGMKAHEHNVQKVEDWNHIVQTGADGEELLLLDSDVAILRPLDDIWTRPFDLAYTVKKRPFPFNLGVMFLRISPPVRAFFSKWLEANLELLAETEDCDAWRHKYGGVNQASFGRLLEQNALRDLQVERLSCAEWNCEESGWPTFDPVVTRILHIKGFLRRSMYRRFPPTPDIMNALTFYRQLEARSLLVNVG